MVEPRESQLNYYRAQQNRQNQKDLSERSKPLREAREATLIAEAFTQVGYSRQTPTFLTAEHVAQDLIRNSTAFQTVANLMERLAQSYRLHQPEFDETTQQERLTELRYWAEVLLRVGRLEKVVLDEITDPILHPAPELAQKGSQRSF
jgi:hypothetical protein